MSVNMMAADDGPGAWVDAFCCPPNGASVGDLQPSPL